MAIAHCSIRNGKPGKGLAHARYVQGEGRYARRDDVVFVEHGNMPSFAASDPSLFWDAADLYERANGRPYREIQFAIPRELATEKDRQRFVDSLVFPLVGQRLPYTLAIHDAQASDGGRNIHVHLMFSERALDGIEREAEHFFRRANSKNPHLGGAKKDRALNARSFVTDVRTRYGQTVNRYLQRVGSSERISMARNEKFQPEPKLGPAHPRADKDPRRDARLVEVQALRQARKDLADTQAMLKDVGREIRAAHAAQKPPLAGRSQRPRRDPKKRAQARQDRAVARAQMRREYEAELVSQDLAPKQIRAAYTAASRQQFRALTEEHRAMRAAIRRSTPPGPARKAQESLAALRAVEARERLALELASARKLDQAAEAERYRAWVGERAQTGDQAAISQLRGWAYADKRRAKAMDQAEAERSLQDGITAPIAKPEDLPDSPASLKRRTQTAFDRESPAALTPAAAKLNSQALAVLARLQHRVDRQSGDVVYLLDKRDVFTDTGRRLTFTAAGVADQAAIAAALGMAREKFGRTITLTGSDAFKARAIEIMVERRMDLQLVDPELEARRQALVAERRQRPASPTRPAAKTPQEIQSSAQAALAARQKMRQLNQPSPEPVRAAPVLTGQDALRAADLVSVQAEMAKLGYVDLQPARPGQEYKGTILMVTTYHLVQNAGLDRAIVHELQQIPGAGRAVGQMATVRYPQEGPATVRLAQAVKKPGNRPKG